MLDITKYITKGLQNTLLFKNTTGTSHNGPWKQVYSDTLLDRWHVGEFSSVEYTISADFDVDNKEIIKVLITASRDQASVVIYARNNTVNDILDVSATVNDSYVDVVLNPVIDAEVGTNFTSAKVIYTAQYFHTQTPLVV